MSTIALAGNPNCGKTTLFNRLTGLRQRVGNYPGVTVERRLGVAKLGPLVVQVVDLPGTYSLVARSRDEAVAYDSLTGRFGEGLDLVVAVVAASNLERSLYLVLSLLELGKPVIVVLNMMDELRSAGHTVDSAGLSEALGVAVVPMSARSGEGLSNLQRAIEQALTQPMGRAPPPVELSGTHETQVFDLGTELPGGRSQALWLLSSLASAESPGAFEQVDHPLAHRSALHKAGKRALGILKAHPELAVEIIRRRHDRARSIAGSVLRRSHSNEPNRTDRLDAVLLHPVWGSLSFLAVMFLLFQSLFAWAAPFMDLIEAGVGQLQGILRSKLPPGALLDLMADGVVGGVGNVIVFVPQIAFLFSFIAVLEDSGYLARAAYVSDRFMSRAGLHGRAFVPLLSGFACAVPAIMAARSIENRRDRLVTILVTPLMTCSARLPVFILIIGTLFAPETSVLGVFSTGGVLLFSMYAISVLTAVSCAFVLKKTILKSPTPPLVLELPPYRLPGIGDVIRRVVERCWAFIKDAGTIILALSIVLWTLLYFPRPDPGLPEVPAVEQSFAGQLGQMIEPVIEPLGYDWRIGVGLLASFAAREVFVSTMALVYGVDTEDAEDEGLRDSLRKARHSDGRLVYTPLVGLSLMVFFLFAAQCMSTIAIIRRETGTWRWPLFCMLYMNALAWLASLLVYQGGRLIV
ncbi:MAG: ferrous iron transport protein B [Myxococcota bacterium]